MEQDRVAVSWSGGKDCALALHRMLTGAARRGTVVHGLLTTMTTGYNRISGHGVHADLLERQAQCVGLPSRTAFIPTRSTMADYNDVMRDAYAEHRDEGVRVVGFGDIFLKGPKKAHLRALGQAGVGGVFPLWGHRSSECLRAFLALGFTAVIICVDTRVLDVSFLGREIDTQLLDDLPPGVDAAGENGEYHTFVTWGPGWKDRVECTQVGQVVRDRLAYCDLRVS